MTPSSECKMNDQASRVKAASRAAWTVIVACVLLMGLGCQQKMAEQPYYRPYEPTTFFADGQSSRPLEEGVVHRAQYLDSDPLVTGLTAEEWGRFWRRDEVKVNPEGPTANEDREHAYGAPRFDPRADQPHSNPAKIYVSEFPFPITGADLSRGAQRYTAYCAECHGPLGNGKGKIWERGYLKPTSYHTEKVEANEPNAYGQIPLGYSRGFWKWDIHIPVREVPIGYIFEVITKGYGAMPDHAAQIPPVDRWRIIAYVRTLQFSQHAEAGKLPRNILEKVTAGDHK
jgi:hypothetical protein